MVLVGLLRLNWIHHRLLDPLLPRPLQTWHNNIKLLLQICQLHFYASTQSFNNIPKVLCRPRAWGTVHLMKCTELTDASLERAWDKLCFERRRLILLAVTIKACKWSASVLCHAVAFEQRSAGIKGPNVCQKNIPHTFFLFYQEQDASVA